MLLSWMQSLVGQSHSAIFPERESLELIARRRAPLLAAVEEVGKLRSLHGEALREYQMQSLKRLLVEAHESVPFYREKYRSAGYSPGDFRSLDDLAAIPLVDKAEWRGASLVALRNREINADVDPRTSRRNGSIGPVAFRTHAVGHD